MPCGLGTELSTVGWQLRSRLACSAAEPPIGVLPVGGCHHRLNPLP